MRDRHGPAGDHAAWDIAGLAARLPYIASLGVDGIWMTPFQPSPQVDQG